MISSLTLHTFWLEEDEGSFLVEHGCTIEIQQQYHFTHFPAGTTRTQLSGYGGHLFLILFPDGIQFKEWQFSDGRSHFIIPWPRPAEIVSDPP